MRVIRGPEERERLKEEEKDGGEGEEDGSLCNGGAARSSRFRALFLARSSVVETRGDGKLPEWNLSRATRVTRPRCDGREKCMHVSTRCARANERARALPCVRRMHTSMRTRSGF